MGMPPEPCGRCLVLAPPVKGGPMDRNWERSILMGCALLIAGLPAWAAGGARLPVVQSRDLVGLSTAAKLGGKLRVENVLKADTGEPAAFVLERFEVFTPDARVTVH